MDAPQSIAMEVPSDKLGFDQDPVVVYLNASQKTSRVLRYRGSSCLGVKVVNYGRVLRQGCVTLVESDYSLGISQTPPDLCHFEGRSSQNQVEICVRMKIPQ